MEARANMGSKGRITIPRPVREALLLREGEEVTFRVEGGHVVLTRTPDLLGLAGSVSVPVEKRGTPWSEARRTAWRNRAG